MNSSLTADQQQRCAYEGAAEALEMTIKRTKARMEEHQSQAERHNETIFIAFDTCDRPQPQTVIGDESESVFLQMDTPSARTYLQRRQLRHEFEANQLSQKLQSLTEELNAIKPQLT